MMLRQNYALQTYVYRRKGRDENPGGSGVCLTHIPAQRSTGSLWKISSDIFKHTLTMNNCQELKEKTNRIKKNKIKTISLKLIDKNFWT